MTDKPFVTPPNYAELKAERDELLAFLEELLNGDVVFTGPSAERLRQQAAELLEPNQEKTYDPAQDTRGTRYRHRR